MRRKRLPALLCLLLAAALLTGAAPRAGADAGAWHYAADFASDGLGGTLERYLSEKGLGVRSITIGWRDPESGEEWYLGADVFSEGAPADCQGFVVPRRVQSLIYAQVVRKLFPDLKVVGAVYLSTMGDSATDHEIAGALDANAVDQVMGKAVGNKRLPRLVCGGPGQIGFEELLDECERRIAVSIEHLVAGDIEANPVDDSACAWCPAEAR